MARTDLALGKTIPIPMNRKNFYASDARQGMALFRDLDQEIRRFQQNTGLRCVKGCGHCCQSTQVETTVLEMIPLALELKRQGLLDECFTQTSKAQFGGRCVFFTPNSKETRKGCCAIYPHRPLVCRLFGFTARPDKRGKNLLVTCSLIKKSQGKKFEKTQELLAQGLSVPLMTRYVIKLLHINFNLGVKQQPINKAIALAVECVALKEKLSRQSSGLHNKVKKV